MKSVTLLFLIDPPTKKLRTYYKLKVAITPQYLLHTITTILTNLLSPPL